MHGHGVGKGQGLYKSPVGWEVRTHQPTHPLRAASWLEANNIRR
jgi:hypothetical protein